jgi:hypothetical protein
MGRSYGKVKLVGVDLLFIFWIDGGIYVLYIIATRYLNI